MFNIKVGSILYKEGLLLIILSEDEIDVFHRKTFSGVTFDTTKAGYHWFWKGNPQGSFASVNRLNENGWEQVV